MAEYRLGDLTFDSEEEYVVAQEDLRRIREIMGKYDISKPEDAAKLLAELGDGDDFLSDYGKRFIEKLRATADHSEKPAKKKAREFGKGKKPSSGAKPAVHVFTARHIIIGTVIVALIVAAVIFLPRLLKGSSSEAAEARRSLVLGYVAEQLKVKADAIDYYETALGMEDAEAKAKVSDILSDAYTIDLTGQNVETMSDASIEMVYTQLITRGDIVNGAYVEPKEITDLKSKIADAKATGELPAAENAADEESAAEIDGVKINMVNQMMDYQYRIAAAMYYEYSQFDLEEEEIQEYLEEDMEKAFGHNIYALELTDEEKLMYYDDFVNRGLFADRQVVRFSPSPVVYGLPELNPRASITLPGADRELTVIQESVAPVASVAYRLVSDGGEGYLMLRGNSDPSTVLLDSNGNTTYVQGDYMVRMSGVVTIGEWYMDGANIGLLIDGSAAGRISNIYELKY